MGVSSVLREASSVLTQASLAVKIVIGVILAGYALSLWEDTALRVLSVTPGYFWPPHFWLWTAFTHCALEIHWWAVLLDVAAIALVGKLLEPLWGAIEMLVFFTVVNVGVAILSAFFYYLLYMVTFNTDLLFDVHIHGMAGYLAGVSVAVKQVMPDHILYRSPLGKITNRHVPLILFGLTLILWAGHLAQGSYCTMFGSGLLVSWTYLRFYQIHSNGSRGDMAENFAFHTFFPNVFQPPVAMVSSTIFSLLVKLKICRRPVRKYDIGSSGSSISISLPGVESHDTERRRQIALKALSERLNQVEGKAGRGSSPASDWPSLEGEDEDRRPLLESVHIPMEAPVSSDRGAPSAQPVKTQSSEEPPTLAASTDSLAINLSKAEETSSFKS